MRRSRFTEERIIGTLADSTNGLSEISREVIAELFDFLGQIDLRVRPFVRRIEAVFGGNAECQR